MRPNDSSSALTWDLALKVSDRHVPDIRATWANTSVVCAECAGTWPCTARESADETMRLMERCDLAVADFLPNADYAHAAMRRHTARAAAVG